MTNQHSKLRTTNDVRLRLCPSECLLLYRQGIGRRPRQGPLTKADSHCWLVDDSGKIYDPSPMLSSWVKYEPTLHYKIACNSDELVADALSRWSKPCSWHDFYLQPMERNCYANACHYQQHHPHLKLVAGSQGFRGKNTNVIFWEFG